MFKALWTLQFYHNPLADWLLAATVALTVALSLRLVKVLVVKRLRRTAPTTDTMVDDVVLDIAERTSGAFHLAMGILAASTQLELSERADGRVRTAVILISILQAGLWGTGLVHHLIAGFVDRRAEPGDVSYRTGKNMLRFAGLLAIWGAAVLMAMENVGINVSTLVTGLGVTGVAVSFAAQGVLGDIIASILILLDKPFLVGDFIICDAYLGSVEKIGVRSTRLRSLSGESIVLANSDLTKSRLRNFKTMVERRIVFAFGLPYDTPPASLKKVPEMLRAIVAAEPLARFDRAHLLSFGESALQFEVVYYMLTPDYTAYCDVQQRVNLGLLEALAAHKMQFAYRTQVSYTYSMGPAPTAGAP